MSFKILEKAFQTKILCPVSKLVYICISHMPQASNYRLSQHCELSDDSIRIALNYLIENEFVERREGLMESPEGNVYQYKIL